MGIVGKQIIYILFIECKKKFTDTPRIIYPKDSVGFVVFIKFSGCHILIVAEAGIITNIPKTVTCIATGIKKEVRKSEPLKPFQAQIIYASQV